MADPLVSPCVLVVADSDRLGELVTALSELHNVDVLVSSGGDDTIDLFEARRPAVIVLTASLRLGDAKSLIVTLRGLVPRGEVAIVVIGDDAGPVRTALDALDLAPDRFVTRPLSAKALRFAVTGGIDAVRLARSGLAPRPTPAGAGTTSGRIELVSGPASALRRIPSTAPASTSAVTPLASSAPPTSSSAVTRVSNLAPVTHTVSSAVTRVTSIAPSAPATTTPPATPPTPPSAQGPEIPGITRLTTVVPAPPTATSSVTPVAAAAPVSAAPVSAATAAPAPTASTGSSVTPLAPAAPASPSSAPLGTGPVPTTRAALRARWEALADSIMAADDDGEAERVEAAPPVQPADLRSDAALPPARSDNQGDDTTSSARAALIEIWRAVEQAQAEAERRADARRPTPVVTDHAEPAAVERAAPAVEHAEPVVAAKAAPAVEHAESAVAAQAARAIEPAEPVAAAQAAPTLEPAAAEHAAPAVVVDRPGALTEHAEPAADGSDAPTGERPASVTAAPAQPVATERSRPLAAERSDAVLADRSVWRAAGVTPIERPGHALPGESGKPERSERARIIDRPWDPEPRKPAEPGHGESHKPPGEPVLPPPVVIKPRRRQTGPVPVDDTPSGPWSSVASDELLPPREPTLILRDPEPAPPPPIEARTQTGDARVVVAARTSSQELWSEPMPIPALVEREPRVEAAAPAGARDELGLPIEDFDDDLVTSAREPAGRGGVIVDEPDARQSGPVAAPESRDFARELRAKMSMMAQRLFQGTGTPTTDHGPRHDHHAEIDLASLGDEPSLGSITEIEARAQRQELRDVATAPGSWDTQVRERGLPDTGAIVRGVSDAAMLLARMFAQGATGRVGFRRDEVETIVYFDHGRPVFASSNEPRDRMGELLLREGKITASQYERCQAVVAESGRRMGEILVDVGYLKRRELLPAVRRHVEDLVYSLFGWDRGTYYIALDTQPCAERIRLSRHPAALILEGIRRKLDRTNLERLIGPPSTVIDVRDRERLGGIVNMGDLAPEERGALAAFDGQADLAQVAHTAGVDIADVLPLAWGLCVLGLATARRTDTEIVDETTALVGETDLAIDRERVRARWQLVTEADYFALLGVRRDATAFEIRRAYQSARRDFAADCFPGDLRRELARELDDIAHVLDEAFRVLRDDRLRQAYLVNLIDS